MSNDRWETPDILGMINPGEPAPEAVIPPYEAPVGFAPQPPMAGVENGQYVVNPDFAEILGLDYDDLIKTSR